MLLQLQGKVMRVMSSSRARRKRRRKLGLRQWKVRGCGVAGGVRYGFVANTLIIEAW
jgi:hypothetical protein